MVYYKKKIIGRRPQKRLRQSYSTERRITVMKRNLAQFLLLTVLLSGQIIGLLQRIPLGRRQAAAPQDAD